MHDAILLLSGLAIGIVIGRDWANRCALKEIQKLIKLTKPVDSTEDK